MTAKKTETNSFAGALAALQGEMPKIQTTDEGQEGNRKFQYAALDTIMPKIQPSLTKHGFAIVHQVVDGDMVSSLLHISGERVVSTIALGEIGDWKGFGSAMTYARRYNVLSLLNLAPTGEDDMEKGDNQKRKATNTKKSQTKEPEKQAEKAGQFTIQHCDENGEVSEVHYDRTPNGVKNMIERFETSMDHEPSMWFANRDTILDVYNKAKGVEIVSPAMGSMTFGQWCENLNEKMGKPEDQQS